MRVIRGSSSVPHVPGNPRPVPVIVPFAGPVVAAQIITPFEEAKDSAPGYDPRYRRIAPGAPELGNLAGEGLRENIDKVWYAVGSSSVPIGQRPRGGLPGFMPSRPANSPNTKFTSGGTVVQRIRPVDPLNQPIVLPPTPQEKGTVKYPLVGFFTDMARLQSNQAAKSWR